MAKTVKFHVEVVNRKVWGYLHPSSGDPSDTPINEVLRWIVEQINFGNWQCTADDAGRITSLIIGATAAADDDNTTVEQVAEKVRSRLRSLNFAGIFARGREEGVEPQNSALAETVRMNANDAGYNNTEIHYAFELLDILERVRANSFVFTSPPIKGIARQEVVALLREATRAYLFELRRSCVSLCRALVEAALRDCVNPSDLLNERWKSKKGELECLINVAARCGVLTPKRCGQAHRVRQAGNNALHGGEPTDEATWAILLDTRAVVEAVCSETGGTI
jgi:hypothetical protein